jgi:uncharacterized lipoprotein YddW (UPF0748 family)
MSKFHKAVWGGPDYAEGPEAVAPMVDRLARAGFDLIIPFVERGDGSVQYHSKIANIDPAFKDWDLLAVLAKEAEKAGLKVHPCLDPFRAGENSPIKDESLYERNRDGELLPWLCPATKEARRYKLDLYEELMDSYPIAGVHMDHIRYHSEDECFCERCRSGFKAEAGTDPLKIGRVSEFNAFRERAQNRKHPAWARWVEWRAGWITMFVEELSESVKARGKELSAAVFMEYPECIVYEGQDWGDWGEKGLVDYMFPMTYTNSTLMVSRRTRNHIAQVKEGCHMWEGLGKRSSRSTLSTEALVEQARAAGEEEAEGIVIFSYSSLTDEDLAALSALI